MKFRKQNFNLFLVGGIFAISACGVKTDMLKNNYTVTPNPLELKGDSISITVEANIPANSINPKANVQFRPYLQTPSGEVALRTMTVGGESAVGVDKKVNSKTGGKLIYTEKIPYTPNLKRVTMYADFAINTKGTYTPVPNAKGKTVLAEGTNITALMINKTGGNMTYDVTDYSAASGNKMVNIFFPINVDRFNAGFKVKGLFDNKKQLDSLKKVLKSNKNWMVQGVSVNAYASPDGELNINDKLAQGRSKSTYNYMKKELKKLGFTEANDQNFKVGYTLSEDWAGYAKNVDASNHPDKQGVMAIINDKGINDADREAKIKRDFPKFWNATKNTLLPSLRRSELAVTGTTPIKSDSVLLTYIDKLTELSDIELLHLGTVVLKDAAKREAVYTQLTITSPADWRGFNDLGAIQVESGKIQDGAANLEKANSMSPENAIVLTNLANVARMNGDYNKAADLYKQAAAKGGDASYGLGIIAIKKGNYPEAVSNLNKANKKDLNMALALLLNGDANGAQTVINEMKPEELTWQAYYLRAITGARLNNQDLLTTNLTRAVELNGEVRAMAKEDVEFIKFWSNPVFQTAIR